jgi:hypothetical protein
MLAKIARPLGWGAKGLPGRATARGTASPGLG